MSFAIRNDACEVRVAAARNGLGLFTERECR